MNLNTVKQFCTMVFVMLATANAFAQTKKLNPTIYYIKSINMKKQNCDSKKVIHSVSGKPMLKVCAYDYKTCVIEGTCAIKKNDEVTIINFMEEKAGLYLFKVVDKKTCPFGYGVKKICLDPYFSVAADLKYHKPGDVIFVEDLKGVKLPNGEVHDGFFIVRDKGGAIKGANRFDFYTGLVTYRDDANPFTPLGFSNQRAAFSYRKATAKEAYDVRKSRNFPGLPN